MRGIRCIVEQQRGDGIGQKFAGALVRRQFKKSVDFRIFRSGAHMIGVGSLSENELQRADDNGFSGTCFAGHDIETGSETQFEGIDEKQVFDTKFMEHVADVCRANGWTESRQIATRLHLNVGKRSKL